MTRVYKILDGEAWEAARRAGVFDGADVDRADGFIHLSTAAQAGETARRHFAGRLGLVIAGFEAEVLGPALRWEPSRGGDLFPHLFAPLDPGLAIQTSLLPLNADGWPDPGDLAP